MIHDHDLNRAEQAVLRDYEAGAFRSIRGTRAAKARYQQAAQWTLSKPRSINIRLAEGDLQRIKVLAARYGLPYQTFISALVHQHSLRSGSGAPSARSVAAKAMKSV